MSGALGREHEWLVNGWQSEREQIGRGAFRRVKGEEERDRDRKRETSPGEDLPMVASNRGETAILVKHTEV
ncbi:hypothetical protein PVC01_040018900 [Plasmodium vivax]|uniref:(malaria parasite P. vivax) hypothetical protein n=1 Tax=Plasmodium vivax TaxID=5855 RepID=A0A1G4GST8_PLAVI|nr:unnamed protein product [Plasmodium vivax]CAI7718522.1 hypothetical protein PVPAM_040026600 [Plasmodium vivax]SCO65664.1 hypothetical protein PVT01_040018300 [Plasmodium vivax]SCO71100.1 hypothetical protein PVC01_040018900 [Plasmodium vivax]